MMMPRLYSKARQKRLCGEVDKDLNEEPHDPDLEESCNVDGVVDILPTAGIVGEILMEAPELLPCGPVSKEPWCMPVLRTEARLRLGQEYIGSTRKYFDAGLVAPPAIDMVVEKQALGLHGYSDDKVDEYRATAKALPLELRQQIFFLRVNDHLFHPETPLVGSSLRGTLLRTDSSAKDLLTDIRSAHAWTSIEEVLIGLPRAVIVASTGS